MVAAEDVEEKVLELKNQGNEHFGKGQPEKAVQAYSKGLELDPENYLLFSNRAAAYLKLNNLEKAVSDARECVRLAPEWPKGYTRLGQALYRTGDLDQCDEAINKLEALEEDNRMVPTLRNAVKLKRVFEQLKGKWYGKVSDELGGYVQTFEFQSESQVLVSVFGRQLLARLKLNVAEDPMWLDLLVHQEPGQPPAPEVKHIFRIDGDELDLCSPYMTPPEVRPSKFDGPAYVKMLRGEPPVDDKAAEARNQIDSLSMDERVIRFARAIRDIVPNRRLGPELETMPQDSLQAQEAVLLSVKFQNAYFELKNVYGDDVEERLQRFLMKERPAKTAELREAVDELRKAMQNAGMYPEDEDTSGIESLGVDTSGIAPAPAQNTASSAAPAAAPAAAAPAPVAAVSSAKPPAADEPTPGGPKVDDKTANDPKPLILALGAAALAAGLIALFALRKQK